MAYNNSESPFMQRKEELLSRINEVKTILDKMKKRGRCFSFNSPVKFGKIRVDEIVLQLMKDCTVFVNDVSKERRSGRTISIDYDILWFYKYKIAYSYYKENGHFYVDKESKVLHSLKLDQRRKFYNTPHKRKNRPDDTYNFKGEEYKIMLMEAIAMVWDSEQEDWNMYYSKLVDYFNDMGHTYVQTHWVVDGLDLGAWVYKICHGKIMINVERRLQLEAVNFPERNLIIKGTSFWEQAFLFYVEKWFTSSDVINRYRVDNLEFDIYIKSMNLAIEYDGVAWHTKKEDIEREIKKDSYCKSHGIRLYRIREPGLLETPYATNYFLKEDFTVSDFDNTIRKIMSEVLGLGLVTIDTEYYRSDIIKRYMSIEGLPNYRHLKEIVDYKRQHLKWPSKSEEYRLWRYMCVFREAYKGRNLGLICNEMFEQLESENFPFDPYNEKFERFFSHAERYFKEHGNLNIKHQYVDNYEGEPYRLGDKLAHIKQRHPDVIDSYKVDRGRPLTPNQIERLEAIGIVWLKR